MPTPRVPGAGVKVTVYVPHNSNMSITLLGMGGVDVEQCVSRQSMEALLRYNKSLF